MIKKNVIFTLRLDSGLTLQFSCQRSLLNTLLGQTSDEDVFIQLLINFNDNVLSILNRQETVDENIEENCKDAKDKTE